MRKVKMTKEDFYKEENLKESEWVESPSGKYKMLIRRYFTKKGYGDYSRGTVYNGEREVCDIKRNYSIFHHSFVEKNNQEWLITGRDYMGQTIVCLDTGEEFNSEINKFTNFCWSKAFLSPDENTLVVDGCMWAAPYEFRFYDFTDPRKGWKPLNIDRNIDADDQPIFNDDGTITCVQICYFFLPLNKFRDDIDYDEEIEGKLEIEYDDDNNMIEVECVKTTYRREGDKIVKIGQWISDKERERIEERKKKNEEYLKWYKDYVANDTIYLEYNRLVKFYDLRVEYCGLGICYKTWGPEECFGQKMWAATFGEHYGSRADLEWSIETGPIKVSRYDNSEIYESKFFDFTVDGMREAFGYIMEHIKYVKEKNEQDSK